MDALRVPCLAEKALVYLHAEQNLLGRGQLAGLADRLRLDRDYLDRRLQDNHRPPLSGGAEASR